LSRGLKTGKNARKNGAIAQKSVTSLGLRGVLEQWLR
jgi:hypothetical protein